uniref:glutathione transferase n=1 Tax=Lotharella oceanica TaxID=641309 RepID=A0A7S2TWS8_9EUKA
MAEKRKMEQAGESKKKAKNFVLGYWMIRGLAAPLRMALTYANIPFEDKQYELEEKEGGGYDASAWFKGDKPELAKQNPLINLPYIVHDGKVWTQTNCCLMYVAKLAGLDGGDPLACEQLLCQVMDLRNDAVKIFYASDPAPLVQRHLEKSVPSHMTKFENWLKLHKTTYLHGESPSVSDMHLWEMIDVHEAFAKHHKVKSFIADAPGLQKLYKTLRADPKLKAYFDGSYKTLPINNKVASFGAKLL